MNARAKLGRANGTPLVQMSRAGDSLRVRNDVELQSDFFSGSDGMIHTANRPPLQSEKWIVLLLDFYIPTAWRGDVKHVITRGGNIH
jgi:hypothetical protein